MQQLFVAALVGDDVFILLWQTQSAELKCIGCKNRSFDDFFWLLYVLYLRLHHEFLKLNKRNCLTSIGTLNSQWLPFFPLSYQCRSFYFFLPVQVSWCAYYLARALCPVSPNLTYATMSRRRCLLSWCKKLVLCNSLHWDWDRFSVFINIWTESSSIGLTICQYCCSD